MAQLSWEWHLLLVSHLPLTNYSTICSQGSGRNRQQGPGWCSSYCSQSNCILPRPVGSSLRHCWLPTDWCPGWSGWIAVCSGESHQFWPICWVVLLAVFFCVCFFSSVSIFFIILQTDNIFIYSKSFLCFLKGELSWDYFNVNVG